MGLLGTFILAFGWFGFNPGSALGISGGGLERVGIIAAVTMIASVAGGLTAALYMIFRVGKPDPTMIGNDTAAVSPIDAHDVEMDWLGPAGRQCDHRNAQKQEPGTASRSPFTRTLARQMTLTSIHAVPLVDLW